MLKHWIEVWDEVFVPSDIRIHKFTAVYPSLYQKQELEREQYSSDSGNHAIVLATNLYGSTQRQGQMVL